MRIFRADIFEEFEVGHLALAGDDAFERLEHTGRADAAERAFAAAFPVREVEEVTRGLDHAAVLADHDHAAGTHDGAELLERVVVDRRIEKLDRDAAAGRTAGLDRLDLLRVRAADIENDFRAAWSPSEPRPDPGFFRSPASAKSLVPLLPSVPIEANAAAPSRRISGTLPKVSTLLIIDRDGPASRGRGRERRRKRGVPPLPFERRDERGLFAADESAGSLLDDDLKLAPGDDIELVLLNLGDGDLQVLDRHRILGAAVDEKLVAPVA